MVDQRAEAGDGARVVQIVGDKNRVTLSGAAELRLSLRRHMAQPGKDDGDAIRLVPWRRAATFRGRQAEWQRIDAWLDAAAPRVDVMTLTGEAGDGKTRLAIEICEARAQQGWAPGFVDQDALKRFVGQDLTDWRWTTPTLAVVDYAAEQAETLRAWLNALAQAPDDGPKLRLLLLERQASHQDGWLAALAGRTDDTISAAIRQRFGEIRIEQLGRLAAADAAALFDEICPDDGKRPPDFAQQLAALSWGGRQLLVQAAAMVARQAGAPAALALSRINLANEIADRELARIGRIAGGPQTPQGKLLAHCAAVITLLGGVTRDDAAALIAAEQTALGRTNAGHARDIRDLLAQATELRPVEPDMIGEALILRALGEGDAAEADEAVGRALARDRAATTARLIRLAQDFATDHATTPLLWLDQAVVAAEAAGPDALIEFCDALPHASVVLADLSLRATEAISEMAPLDGKPLVAGVFHNLATRLSHLGRREEALAAAAKAVGLRRALHATQPDAFAPALARSLHNLGNRLSDLGRREEALAAAEEAVELARTLYAAQPYTFAPDLAKCIHSLCNRLSDLGRREEALAAAAEAVDLRRALHAARPDAFAHDLASSVNALANRLSQLGRPEEALAAATEAVALYRALHAARPDAFAPDLAGSLITLSKCLSEPGRHEEALAAAEEAVTLYRAAHKAQPDAFAPSLARSLTTLSHSLSDLGRGEEGLAAAAEAVDLRRALHKAQPDAFAPDLASGLNNLSTRLSDVGRYEEALAAAEEAVALYRGLHAARPDLFAPKLAGSLGNLAERLSALERHDDALAAATEAVERFRVLHRAHPDAFTPQLAASLGMIGAVRREMADDAGALAACREGFALATPYWRRQPAAFHHLMRALAEVLIYEIAVLRQELGSVGPLPTDEEAAIFDALWADDPNPDDPDPAPDDGRSP